MKIRSTSIHSLNADRGLSHLEKFLYLVLNWVNNLFPYSNLDERISIRFFDDRNWERELTHTYESSSVGRRLSDIYWRTLPWQAIEEELGQIHILDTGCGQGNYATRLLDASGGRVASYTGIDAKRRPNWAEVEKKNPKFKFIESSSSDISKLIPPETNLFVTQSAIEHFDEDLGFFEQIREYISKGHKPVIQIHNFPARAILPLYLFHGVRQYTPRTVSKITRLFNNSKFYLYGLGGEAGKKMQWKYFTWPLLILRRKAKWSEDVRKYNADIVKAIMHDIEHPSRSPIFWVLIIQSNPRITIW